MNTFRGSCFLCRIAGALAAALASLTCAHAASVSISESSYGVTGARQPVREYTLINRHGDTLKVITYGGIVAELDAPDRQGRVGDVVLGFASLADYERYNGNIHFGALIGRYANRIANGRFKLDGELYRLPTNDGPNTLHSGPHSFDSKVWTPVRTFSEATSAGVQLRYISPDGENGFPGTLTVDVTYSLSDDNAIHIDYRATTDKDTVVNLTNHSYFNLAGEASGTVERQLIEIAASHYTPTDQQSIPTGEVSDVEGTPMDLRALTPIGAHLRDGFAQLLWAHGYDQNWVLDNGGQHTPAFAARAYDPGSGRVLDVYTTQPGLQFYTANGLNGSVVGMSGRAYRQGDAFALEAEHFPDSPNHPAFPTTELKPGQTLHEVTIWRLGVR
ncbi:galactose-1-epimerase [Trinickia dabaoshanensis]|uniref:Aldose 1-epimerase n=1 Tax=Trinickia dabaoshanensis TaxID=564714 RepID=A0A2N7W3A2_9BURK|nr:aldose epimerase family protein [Trinickia dabaoshanensis]PMS23889.1 galactose-1-epimerase [Trinickia dabaoshanensis]